MALKIDVKANVAGAVQNLSKLKESLRTSLQGVQAGAAGGLLQATWWGILVSGIFMAVQWVRALGAEFMRLRQVAASLGATRVEMLRMSDAAKFAGVELSAVTAVLTKLRDAEIKAANGGKDAVQQLQALGLTVANLQSMNPDEKIRAISKALESISDPAKRAAVSLALFGKMPEEIRMMSTELKGLPMDWVNDKIGDMADKWTGVGAVLSQVAKWLAAVFNEFTTLFALMDLYKKTVESIGFKPAAMPEADEQSKQVERAKKINKVVTKEAIEAEEKRLKAVDAIAKKFSGVSDDPAKRAAAVSGAGATSAVRFDQLRRIGALGGAGNTGQSNGRDAYLRDWQRLFEQAGQNLANIDTKTPAPGASY